METEAISKTVLIERDGPIVTVVLNRPEKLNAINKATWIALGDAIDELETDDDVRCIVLRGAGDKAFSPGADISEFETERANRDKARAYNSTVENTIDALGNCRHPTLALIKGICIGGGLEAAAFCDMRICGQSSTLELTKRSEWAWLTASLLTTKLRLNVMPQHSVSLKALRLPHDFTSRHSGVSLNRHH